MILFKKSIQLAQYCKAAIASGDTLGFVPTMGALHKGHLSLLNASSQNNNLTVCSIFINPTQFNDTNDFKKYPVSLENDIILLEQSGIDVLFLPHTSEVYPNGITQMQKFDLGNLDDTLEGKYRPGHFQGVCQVMHRLLSIVQPHQLYMGQKDYQQCMVIKRLLQITHSPVKINICDTLREPDGLAMSSRNMRLTNDERSKATGIYEALTYIKENVQPGTTAEVLNKAIAMLHDKGFRIDYVTIANAITLENIPDWNGEQNVVALIAAFLNEVRLIDNMIVN